MVCIVFQLDASAAGSLIYRFLDGQLVKQSTSQSLDFMQAAQYRDEIIRLQKELEEKG